MNDSHGFFRPCFAVERKLSTLFGVVFVETDPAHKQTVTKKKEAEKGLMGLFYHLKQQNIVSQRTGKNQCVCVFMYIHP